MSTPHVQSAGGGYQFGYSTATTSSHAARTIDSDAAFVIPHVRSSFQILDVGCGPGTITVGFAALVDPSQGGSVTGVDAGAPVLERARQHLSSSTTLPARTAADAPHVTFQQANVLEGLPFADDTFDLVFTSQTLAHLSPAPEAPVAALREMRRVLKPGGLLAARDAASLTYHPYRAELQRQLVDRMYAVMGTHEPCGPHMPQYLRMAGWDTSSASGKVQFGAGTMVVTGPDKCRWWRDTMGGRLAPGDPFRASWVRAGISEDECDATKALVERWAASEDAWHGVLQSEVLAWK